MNVRKTAETALTVSLAWDTVPGARGFIYLIDGSDKLADEKRHFTFDGAKTSVTIAKPPGDGPHSYTVQALGVSDSGTWADAVPAYYELPTREHHLVGSSSIACREDYASPVTGPRTRWWQFDPAYSGTPAWVASVGVLPRELWILSQFAILEGGLCGRIVDGHSEVSDTDIQDHAKEPGGGVSAFAIDHNQGADQHGSWDGIHYVCEAEGDDHGNQYHFPIVPAEKLSRGKKYALKTHLTLGRRGTSTPGAVRIWALDFDAMNPVIDLAGISTVWGNQSVMHFLQGPYNFGATAAVQMAANRFGRTEAEALADQPVYTGPVAGRGPNDYSTPITPGWTV